MLETSTWNAERAKEIVADHAGLEGPMLPILHGSGRVRLCHRRRAAHLGRT